MKINFEYVTNLQYNVKALTEKVRSYESGEAYVQLRKLLETVRTEKDRIIASLKKELEEAHQENIRMRNCWMQVLEDMEKEYKKAIHAERKNTARMEQQALATASDRDHWKDKWREQQISLYESQAKLEAEKEKNRKLTAQVNRDFENSSIPSSMQPVRKKRIVNSRERTGKHPGGQSGHKGHSRKQHSATEIHDIPAPATYQNNQDYYETGRIIRKQKIMIQMEVKVIEYRTKEYRNRTTGARVHASFPEGYVNEVTYDGTVKALAFLLSNECGVSHAKIRKLIYELTKGEVELSDGMINSLCGEFSKKATEEKQEIIRRLMTSPVMNADFTNANVNGKSAQVLVLASPSNHAALYIGKEKKGDKGIEGTPLVDFVGTVVHDHDLTFYHYGRNQQECIQHDCRYLISSKENEPELEWNHQMHDLIRGMLHYRNSLGAEEKLDPEIVAGYEERYDAILDKAQEEYEYEPPSEYYKDGYNLFIRLKKFKENELLFLHDKRVPANNSLCERLARVFKRKQKQAMAFRSQESLNYVCDGLSVVYLLRNQADSVYQKISDIFCREKPSQRINPAGSMS